MTATDLGHKTSPRKTPKGSSWQWNRITNGFGLSQHPLPARTWHLKHYIHLDPKQTICDRGRATAIQLDPSPLNLPRRPPHPSSLRRGRLGFREPTLGRTRQQGIG